MSDSKYGGNSSSSGNSRGGGRGRGSSSGSGSRGGGRGGGSSGLGMGPDRTHTAVRAFAQLAGPAARSSLAAATPPRDITRIMDLIGGHLADRDLGRVEPVSSRQRAWSIDQQLGPHINTPGYERTLSTTVNRETNAAAYRSARSLGSAGEPVYLYRVPDHQGALSTARRRSNTVSGVSSGYGWGRTPAWIQGAARGRASFHLITDPRNESNLVGGDRPERGDDSVLTRELSQLLRFGYRAGQAHDPHVGGTLLSMEPPGGTRIQRSGPRARGLGGGMIGARGRDTGDGGRGTRRNSLPARLGSDAGGRGMDWANLWQESRPRVGGEGSGSHTRSGVMRQFPSARELPAYGTQRAPPAARGGRGRGGGLVPAPREDRQHAASSADVPRVDGGGRGRGGGEGRGGGRGGTWIGALRFRRR